MNNKRWLTLLGGMLMALFLVGLSPPGRASAVSPSAYTDDLVPKFQTIVGHVQEEHPDWNTYIVYTCGNDDSFFRVALLCEPSYMTYDDKGLYLHISCSKNPKCQLPGMCQHGGFSYWEHPFRLSTDDYFYDGDSLASYGGSDAEIDITLISQDGFDFSDWSSKYLFASNVSFKDKDGTVFFDRAPLAASWLKTADQAIQEKLVEVRKNKPHLPQLGQIRTGLILVVCCLVSLALLSKLLRVWRRSLIR